MTPWTSQRRHPYDSVCIAKCVAWKHLAVVARLSCLHGPLSVATTSTPASVKKVSSFVQDGMRRGARRDAFGVNCCSIATWQCRKVSRVLGNHVLKAREQQGVSLERASHLVVAFPAAKAAYRASKASSSWYHVRNLMCLYPSGNSPQF